jgi:hypothetical protein
MNTTILKNQLEQFEFNNTSNSHVPASSMMMVSVPNPLKNMYA